MSQTPRQEIQEAFSKVSTAINQLEVIIRKYHDTPRENIASTEFQKINIPGQYIRTRLHFENEYRLRDLIGNSKQRDSIAYSLMQSDLHNYLINRLQVWGIVEKLLLKGALVNLVSVIEAIIMSSLGHLHEFCRISENLVCKNNCRCQYYIKSSKHLKIAQATEILKDKLAMNDEGILANIITINSIRNNIHLSILDTHEFINKDYSIENYNKAIRVLGYLKSEQSAATANFVRSRSEGCTGLISP